MAFSALKERSRAGMTQVLLETGLTDPEDQEDDRWWSVPVHISLSLQMPP
jgi:hypothetical protein